MPVRRNDKLQKTFNSFNADSRFATWLWILMKYNYPDIFLGEFRGPDMRNLMAETIINQPGLKQTIENQNRTDFLPEQSLQWITNKKRQNAFLMKKLIEKNGFNYTCVPDNLTGRDLTIAAIDIWQIDKTKKSEIINQIRSEWEIHTESDHLFKWFDDPDEKEKLNTAWEITKDKYSFLVFHQNQPQERDDFIILLDSILITTSEKILLMNSIKKRWSQNKYRAKNTGKKQYNFILSDKTIKRLDKLADKHDLKRTQVLDILLKMEEEKGIYIQERLKQLIDS
ncbi:TPA: hypothetical protein ACP31I_001740 [Pseudomonas aeruginosa]|uniref:hypothetical protein n=1 Tax=Pseudomonas aeruginosa TaxID=287 RepID=UPI00223B857F|nr:hypothetical protein [Pseudomonas aeruginosa]MDY1474096.1 hypothetical protein [Pseudomonas aeruginosa]